MDEQEVWPCYALALALTPDPNIAGDLFAAAGDLHDLRRRLERWRRANGLPPAPAQPELPVLDAAQREHALHIWRQARRRRRLAPVLGAAAGALLVVALLMAGASYRTYRASLPADPAFAGPSVAAAGSTSGLQFTVYRAEASPTQVTVWWAVDGPGARAYASGEAPLLYHPFTGRYRRRQPAGNQTTVLRSGRVLGKSTYPAQGQTWQEAILALRPPSDREPPLRVDFPVTAHDAPGTRVLTPRQTVRGDGWSATLEQVRIAPDYVAVRSRLGAAPGWVTLQRLEMQVNGKPVALDEIQASDGTANNTAPLLTDQLVRESIFPPLPAGATNLQVRYLCGQVRSVEYDLQQPPVRITRNTSDGFSATLGLPKSQVVPMQLGRESMFVTGHTFYPIDSASAAPDPEDPRQTLYTFTTHVQGQPARLRFRAALPVPAGAAAVDLR